MAYFYGRISRVATIAVGLFALFVLPVHAQGQGVVHRILIGDTKDPKLSSGIKRGLDMFSNLTQTIAVNTDRTTTTTRVVESNFSCANILQAVQALNPGPEDLVVIYYGGHGYRDDQQPSTLPKLYCDIGVGGVLLESLVKMVPSTPRMVWAIADACNVTAADIAALPSAVFEANISKGYKALFSQPKGSLTIAGAKPREFSFYEDSGGYFSKQLHEAILAEVTRGSEASWSTVFAKATRSFHVNYKGHPYLQEPMYENALR